MPKKPEILAGDLTFPESPRWRAESAAQPEKGKLWFSDMLAGKVMTVDLSGHLDTVVDSITVPGGLGWSPGNDLIIVSVIDGKIMSLREGELSTIADLQAQFGLLCVDMVMDKQGRAFVGCGVLGGVDESIPPGPGNMPKFGHLAFIDTSSGEVRLISDRMTFPNGPVLTPDGKTLIVAETFGFRLTAFDVGDDATLSNRRVWADLGVPPDGICLDAEGCVWVAVPYYVHGGPGGYLRIADGGVLRDKIDVEDYSPYACTLGGAQMTTLFLCESSILGQPRNPGDGRIRTVEVDVPGTGSP